MSKDERQPWQIWPRIFKFLGGIGCAVVLLWTFGLVAYYSAKRPSEPSPKDGWTVPIQWTHVSYGTPKENDQLLQLHYWFFPFLALGLTGAAIEKLARR
jgi:hypothetical protein